MGNNNIGCTGIKRALELGYLEVFDVYTEPDDSDKTRPVLVLTSQTDDDASALDLNYCPFCGTRFQMNMPACSQKVGIERREVREWKSPA